MRLRGLLNGIRPALLFEGSNTVDETPELILGQPGSQIVDMVDPLVSHSLGHLSQFPYPCPKSSISAKACVHQEFCDAS